MLRKLFFHAFNDAQLRAGLDRGGVGAVAKPEYGGNNKERFDTARLPDPASEERDKNRYEVVDGQSRRDRLLNFVFRFGNILHVDVCRHRSERDNRVEHVIDAADDERGMHREEMVREAVEEADEDEEQRVGDHDDFISEPIDNSADDWG